MKASDYVGMSQCGRLPGIVKSDGSAGSLVR